MHGVDPLGIASLYSPVSTNKVKKKDKSAKTEGKKKTSFSKLIEQDSIADTSIAPDAALPEEIIGKSFEDALQYLIDSVYSSGDVLKRDTSSSAFGQYRKSLSYFMRFVVKHSFEIETVKRGSRLRRKQPYYIVQKINEKLDVLARELLKTQKNQVALLAGIDEINGLVVDVLS